MQTFVKPQPWESSRRPAEVIPPHATGRTGKTHRSYDHPAAANGSAFSEATFDDPHTDTHRDSFFDLRGLVNFEDIPARNGAARVLRCDRSGVSIYVTEVPSRKKTSTPTHHYVVAYEGETEKSQHIKQVILESDTTHPIRELLGLLTRYSKLTCRRMQALKLTLPPLDIDLRRVSGLDSRSRREKISKSLAALACSTINHEAYEGFVNAVMSQADAQLATSL